MQALSTKELSTKQSDLTLCVHQNVKNQKAISNYFQDLEICVPKFPCFQDAYEPCLNVGKSFVSQKVSETLKLLSQTRDVFYCERKSIAKTFHICESATTKPVKFDENFATSIFFETATVSSHYVFVVFLGHDQMCRGFIFASALSTAI